jgi:phage shock protein C
MYKKLYKSRTNKTIAGVCGGLEDYFRIDVTIIRLIWVALTIATGIFPGVLAYVAAALIIPDEPVGYNPSYIMLFIILLFFMLNSSKNAKAYKSYRQADACCINHMSYMVEKVCSRHCRCKVCCI